MSSSSTPSSSTPTSLSSLPSTVSWQKVALGSAALLTAGISGYAVHYFLRSSRSLSWLCPVKPSKAASDSEQNNSSCCSSSSSSSSNRREIFSDISCILFDLDGTLVESKEIWYFLLNAACIHFGYGSLAREKWEPTFGQSMEKNKELFLPQTSQSDLNKFCDEHYADYLEHLQILPNALEILKKCQKKYPGHLVCVTNCPRAITQLILNHCGLNGFFQYVICAGDSVSAAQKIWKSSSFSFANSNAISNLSSSIAATGLGGRIEPKPAPDLALYAGYLLSTAPEKCVLVGDSKYDMQCGRTAGTKTIGIHCDGGHDRIQGIGELHLCLNI